MNQFDVVIVGGGQSGLAVGYYLNRTKLSFIILDQEEVAGGTWQHMWKSLRLFSPAQWSSLPGVIMNGGSDYYPSREETIDYIRRYEGRYKFPVKRPVRVLDVTRENGLFVIKTSEDTFYSKTLVAATGSFYNPFIPEISGREKFKGSIIHSSQYQTPDEFAGRRVAIVGEGNSGAQILAEVSTVTDTLWITQKEPQFLADNIDGRHLFDTASQMYEAKLQGKTFAPPSLGNIVMVPSVRQARSKGVLRKSYRPFKEFTENGLRWDSGHEEKIDAVIFCTGFKASLDYLRSLNIIDRDGRVPTNETKATNHENLWLVGFGNWTGFASATLIGVGRSAKRTVTEIVNQLT